MKYFLFFWIVKLAKIARIQWKYIISLNKSKLELMFAHNLPTHDEKEMMKERISIDIYSKHFYKYIRHTQFMYPKITEVCKS